MRRYSTSIQELLSWCEKKFSKLYKKRKTGVDMMMGNIEYLLSEYTFEEAAYLLDGARGYDYQWWLETLILLEAGKHED